MSAAGTEAVISKMLATELLLGECGHHERPHKNSVIKFKWLKLLARK
jgi:hypothetical protein